MASIIKRNNKKGVSYLIKVYIGKDERGEKVYKSTTWWPPEGMTEFRIKKEVTKFATLFEKELFEGLRGNKTDITFEEYAEKYFRQKQLDGSLAPKTYENYFSRTPRIIQGIGDKKLSEITDVDLIVFYNKLRREGVKKNLRYTAKEEIVDVIKEKGYTQDSLSKRTGLSIGTIRSAERKKAVSKETATKMAKALEKPLDSIFEKSSIDERLPEITIQGYHHTISAILSAAVMEHLIDHNPAKSEAIKFKTKRAEQPIVKTKDEMRELFRVLADKPNIQQLTIRLPLATGLRLGELLALQWKDVDFVNNTISISKSTKELKGNGKRTIGAPKTEKSNRMLAVEESTMNLLYKIKSDTLYCSDYNFVFTNEETGETYLNSTVSKWAKKILVEAGLENLHYYSLRHTFASWLLEDESVATVSEQLGHSSTTITTSTYVHSLKKANQEVANKISKSIFSEDVVLGSEESEESDS